MPNGQTGTTCLICYDDEGHLIGAHRDNRAEGEHHFHRRCLLNWRTHSGDSTCPYCRTFLNWTGIEISPEEIALITSYCRSIDEEGAEEDVPKLMRLVDETGYYMNPQWRASCKRYLRWAIEMRCSLDLVSSIVDLGVDRTSLYKASITASELGNLDLVKCFVDLGADVSDNRALSKAAAAGYTPIVRYLLGKGGRATEQTMQMAASNGHLEVLKCLAEHHGNSSSATTVKNFNFIDMKCAAKRGHTGIIRFMVEKGYDYTDALDLAASHGHLDLVKYLVQRCLADNRLVSEDALIGAATNGHKDVVQHLIETGGVDKDAWNGEAILMAASNGHFGTALYLLYSGANVRLRESRLLDIASSPGRGDPEFLRALLERGGANVDTDDCIVLSNTVAKGDLPMCKYLVEQRGARVVNVRPEIMQEAGKHPEILQFLVEHGGQLAKRSTNVEKGEKGSKRCRIEDW